MQALAELPPGALEQLDEASAQARETLEDIDQTLARMIARHERVFAWLDGRGPTPAMEELDEPDQAGPACVE